MGKPYEGVDPEKSKKVREFFEYYEVESGLLLGTETTSSSPMGEVSVKTTYSDYKKFGDFMAPTVMVQDAGMQKMKMTTDAIEWDTVSADALALPENIKALLDKKKPVQAGASNTE